VPRERRAWAPGDVLSIVGRAHEGRPIFATGEDRRFFLDRLQRVFAPGEVGLLAWALLINHYHLVIRVRDEEPGRLFLRLNTVVARRERRRRGDHGAVFQDRYWSGRCEGEGAAVALLTYVLGNPVHHGVVPTAEALETYEWTAYPEVLGLRAPGLVDARETLALVHPDEAVARRTLREAMSWRVARWRSARDGVDVCEEPGCRGARDACGLVHPERVRLANGRFGAHPGPAAPAEAGISRVHDDRADRRSRLLAAGWRAADLVAAVCARLGADPAAVLRGERRRPESRARSVVACVACEGAGERVGEVARLLGVSGTAAAAARRRGRRILDGLGVDVEQALSWGLEGR
jgi:REP element-mobilizing transposase RayT